MIHGAYAFRINLPVDLSYGIYVLHFPILHLAAALGLNAWGFGWYFLAAFSATVLFAFLSWFLVEKPALLLKTRRKLIQPPQTLTGLRPIAPDLKR